MVNEDDVSRQFMHIVGGVSDEGIQQASDELNQKEKEEHDHFRLHDLSENIVNLQNRSVHHWFAGNKEKSNELGDQSADMQDEFDALRKEFKNDPVIPQAGSKTVHTPLGPRNVENTGKACGVCGKEFPHLRFES